MPCKVETNGLEAAACEVLRCLHEGLRPLEGQVIDSETAFEIFYGKRYAVRALSSIIGRMEAKRRDFALAGGAPLAVCSGPYKTQAIPVVLNGETEVLHMPLFYMGCRIVFPDSLNTRGGGRAWKDWCPDCSPKVSQPGRRLAGAHRKSIEIALTRSRPSTAMNA